MTRLLGGCWAPLRSMGAFKLQLRMDFQVCRQVCRSFEVDVLWAKSCAAERVVVPPDRISTHLKN